MAILAANAEVRITYPGGFLYDATEAPELDESGAAAALIVLKLSLSAQFRDKSGCCAWMERLARRGDNVAAEHLRECRAG